MSTAQIARDLGRPEPTTTQRRSHRGHIGTKILLRLGTRHGHRIGEADPGHRQEEKVVGKERQTGAKAPEGKGKDVGSMGRVTRV